MTALVATARIRPDHPPVVLVLLCLALLPGAATTAVHAQQAAAEATVAPPPAAAPAESAPTAPATVGLPAPTPPIRVLDAGGLAAETAALILGGQQGGSLLFEALALPVAVEGRIPYWLEIDGTDLLADHQQPILQLEIYVYAVSEDGGVEDAQLKVVTVDLERLRQQIARSGVKVFGTLAVPAGDGSLRVLVRNRETQSVGLRIVPLPVAGKGRRQPGLLPPLVTDPVDSWLQVDIRPPADEATVWESAAPGEPGDRGPSARPVVVAGRKIEFSLLSAKLPATDSLVLDVVRFDGTPVTRIAVHSGSREHTAATGWSRSQATFSTDTLGPGDYFVRLLREDAQSVWSAPLPVHVLVRPYDHDVVWAELTGESVVLTPEAAEAEGDSTQSGLNLPVDAIRRGYLDSLRLLAEGRLEASIRALSDLETEALAGSGTALDRLRKVELKVARGLARDDPDLLLPMLQLYQGLYEQKYAERQYLISTHARRMLMALIDLYTNLGEPDTARPIAASFLAALAARLQAAGMPAFSGEIFGRALQLDADNEISLLCLATGLERRGMYPEATEYLRRLVASDPDHWEAQLRLGLVLARNHHFDEAELQLRSTIAGSTQDWVTVVAHQELAAAYLQRDRVDEAEELVRLGLATFPHDQKLRLLRAFLLESRRNPSAARDALDGLIDPDAPTPSPRYKYTQLPANALADTRLELDGLAHAKLADLQAALERRGPGGDS